MSPNVGFRPAGFFAFRTALMPYAALTDWALDLPSAHVDPSDKKAFDSAMEADQAVLRERLRTLMDDPVLQEAVFLASPDLFDALAHWREQPDSPKGRRAERSVVKYFARLSGRSTPFGLFAGCSVGKVGECTRLETEGREKAMRHTRPDMDYLWKLANALVEDPELARMLTYEPNSSLCEVAGRLHYCEGRQKGLQRSYHLVAVDPADYLIATLRRAKGGATISALAIPLVDDEISLEEAEAYLLELVQSQLLVPTLWPSVSGPEPLHEMIGALEGLDHPLARNAQSALIALRDALEAIDAEPLGLSRERYEALADRLRELPVKVEMNRLFQTDLVKPAPVAELGGEVLDELIEVAELLWQMQNHGGQPLSDFVKSFRERYEGREVPLAEALDEEIGIGFGGRSGGDAPLLAGLPFGSRAGRSQVYWGEFEHWLCRRLLEHQASGESVLRLERTDLEPFLGRPADQRPDTFSMMAQVGTESPKALQEGRFQLVFGDGNGPSGMNLLGRFCHGDPDLNAKVEGFLREEEAYQPDVLFAEIVHLPEGRTGNVILRPALRAYEIPFLGRGAADPDHQIPLSDLLISLRGDKVVLRSKRLGKEVVPRLTNAHNFRNRGIGVYRFLATLQYQAPSGHVGWDWGPFAHLPRLPRVELGRTVLAKEKWKAKGKDLASFLKLAPGPRMREIQSWKERLGLPRWIVLVDSDNKLPVDLHNLLSVDAFLDLVEERGEITLEEVFPAPHAMAARGPEGVFAHELVLPCLAIREPRKVAHPTGTVPLHRGFGPGSRWLFAKIYSGPAGTDTLLRGPLHGVIERALTSGAATSWFFIRYSDPGHHLRLRFEGDPARLCSEVLPDLQDAMAPYLACGLASKLTLDTYEPEVARYGGTAALPYCEAIFKADSDLVLSLLQEHLGDAFADRRWRLLFAGTDRLLQDFGLDLAERLRLAILIRDGYREEFGVKGEAEHAFGKRYRKERAALDGLLLKPEEAMADVLPLFNTRSSAITAHVTALRGLEGLDLDGILRSLVHMTSNRLLREEQRPQELAIADFLVRAYESQLARTHSKCKS